MTRHLLRGAAVLCVAGVASFLATAPATGQGADFGKSLKGRIVWTGDVPERLKIDVKVQAEHCGKEILDENIVVNPKNKGVLGAFVWVAPEGEGNLPIHADLKAVAKEKPTVDQPKCMFVPRSVAVREGQEIVFKNSSQIPHNVRGVSLNKANEFNVTLPANGTYSYKPQAVELPVLVKCDIHPWMSARVAVFDHPYFAVTDEDGNFEIKLPPAGKYRLKVYHEYIGWRGGRQGKEGQEIAIQAGAVTDLKDLEIGKAKK